MVRGHCVFGEAVAGDATRSGRAMSFLEGVGGLVGIGSLGSATHERRRNT